MEKTIVVDGQSVQLKSSGGTAMRYKTQFRKDFFTEILKLHKLGQLEKLDLNKMDDKTMKAIDGLDFEVFYNFTWVLAKTANPSIPDPLTWLDTFEEFPLFDFLPEIQEMLSATIQSKKNRMMMK